MIEEFVKEYNALCEKYGKQFVALPQFINRDDGTFSIVVKWLVADKPKEKANDNPK